MLVKSNSKLPILCAIAAVILLADTRLAHAQTSADLVNQMQSLSKEIDAASAKGVGTKPYEAALKTIEHDIEVGQPPDALKKRLDSLTESLHKQVSLSSALKLAPRKSRPSYSGSSSGASSGAISGSSGTPRSGVFDMNTFIYTVRGAVSVGDVSPAFVEEVKREINTLPKALLAELQARGGRVCITPRLADKLPDFRNTKPRGWEEGATGKNVDGLFDGTDVLVCEYSTNIEDDSSLVKNTRVGYIVRHESGHAFDQYWGNVSDSPEYKHTYLLELAKMDPNERDADLAYFAQRAGGGPSECFAELFAIMNGGGSSKHVDTNLAPLFPQCSKMIRQKLGF